MTRSPRYQEIAEDLRRRLAAGEWPVGTTLPGISDLQEEYEVPGLNTIRQAQRMLADEGLLNPVQGRGTFVTALPGSPGDPASLKQALDELRVALAQTQTALTRVMSHLD
ncbi:winged helix-turn-helix domain-containing protein [Verrucosispora sp. NA02020]|uniref:GntR family transcriptional regulator n=1 Tax=Verrucosispora sp. NA02020 TaxID=2742132 RepID=UPI00158FE22B|nr:winged helix-turn-helix domain-containing protein [Verrucosispora sp. NA02020]QKW17607.1 winged helix-turn-helix transcriptional regulator [Verrucosispora sp. NA02020]